MSGLLDFLKLVSEPLLRRLGTALATYLVARGLPDDLAQQFVVVIAIVGGLALDIAVFYLVRKGTIHGDSLGSDYNNRSEPVVRTIRQEEERAASSTDSAE